MFYVNEESEGKCLCAKIIKLYTDFHVLHCNYMIMERQTDRNRDRETANQTDKDKKKDRDNRLSLFLVCCESDNKAAY